ncbi:MAG: hypothetical protein ABI843_01500 [Dokdonella sp.]
MKRSLPRMLLAAALLWLTSTAAAADDTHSYRVSIPTLTLGADERITALHIEIKGARLKSLPVVPAGWTLSMRNETSAPSTLDGAVIVGAAALEADALRDFIVIERSSPEIPLSLRAVLTVARYYEGPRHVRRLRVSHAQFVLRDVHD